MELQLRSDPVDCLRRVTWESKQEEQTQEVKLTDAMPDVGKVLAAWGQVVMRSKEWRGSGMGISGGVMVWVLYAPEDGTQPRSVETWIPIQMRWEFPQTQRDGAMIVRCLLCGVDARAVSARKLMVRACVSVSAEALEPARVEVYTAEQIPEDVCLLRRSYPVRLPTEAGEKTFTVEEDLQLGAECADAQKLIQYTLQPEMIDKKIMGDKVVFRGTGRLHGLCRCADERLRAFDFEVPFSQYTELEREYDGDASVCIEPVLTNLELELQENNQLRLKAGLVGQYVIYDRPMLQLVEDAYSPNRTVTIQTQPLSLPAVLDMQRQQVSIAQEIQTQAQEVLDVSVRAEHPLKRRMDETVLLQQPGSFQVLYYDQEGALQSGVVPWENQQEIPLDQQADLYATAGFSGLPQAAVSAEHIHLRADMAVDTLSVSASAMPMVTALELGEIMPPDPGRPSLILRRVGADSVWDMAKQCGSTVAAIEQANGLTEEPEQGRILLIPVT